MTVDEIRDLIGRARAKLPTLARDDQDDLAALIALVERALDGTDAEMLEEAVAELEDLLLFFADDEVD